MFAAFRRDVQAIFARDPAARSTLEVLLCFPGLHALWFHRSVRVDDWLLYSFDSPSASGARGFARGQFFTRKGTLVASAAQEGLVRVISKV